MEDKKMCAEQVNRFKEWLLYIKKIFGEEDYQKAELYIINAYVTGIRHALNVIIALPENERLEFLMEEAEKLEWDVEHKKINKVC